MVLDFSFNFYFGNYIINKNFNYKGDKMIHKKRNLLDIIINIIIILLAILVIYWLIKLLFGGSPGLDEFNFALILMLAGFLIKLYRETGEIKIGMKYSFNKIKDDMNLIKGDMNLIKGDMNLIKNKLKV